ncbi:MAG: acetyl-CoA carboxylase carboxyl transferase subunit alpha, partial [Chitinophagaceae bacterium]
MPSNANRQFLEFEKPIKDLIDEIEKLKHASEHKKIDYSEMINKLDQQILNRRKEITQSLTSWQKVQLSRHPDRPYTLKYIQNMTTNFVEL